MPPRHGKSELVSRRLPAYAFGLDPNLSIISASYSADLASRMNRDVQRIIDSPKYNEVFPNISLSNKQSRKEETTSYLRNSDIFEIVGFKGSYRSAGVQGGISGMGADIAIIDDPIKDMREASSTTVRNSIWDWYTSTLSTRLEKDARILVTMTRWHKDDLVGRILDIDKSFETLIIPAINDKGEALWSEKYNIETLLEFKKNLGTKVFTSLYQQTPTIDGGSLIKNDWLRFYDFEPNKSYNYVMSWDMAFKGTKDSDYVVGQIWARHPKDPKYYLVDQIRGKWDFPKTIEQFIAFSKKWPMATKKIVESKANGQAVIDTLKKHIEGIVPFNPKDSKEARLHSISPLFEAGNIYLPINKDFTNDFVDELINFPYHKHDDQVDACTQALLNFKTSQAKFAFVKSSNVLPFMN